MKTIKQRHFGKKGGGYDTYLLKEDVLELIDEWFKETWTLINKKNCQIIWGHEIEELKAKIKGK